MEMTTGVVRLSYVNFFTPRAGKDGDKKSEKYSVTLLIPKSDVKTKTEIDRLIDICISENAATFVGINPAYIKRPIHDGDGYRENGTEYAPECKGHWVMTASSKFQQSACDENCQNIINPAKLYSGCYAVVVIHFFKFEATGNKGISCGLGCLKKVADGEPLGSVVSDAATVFGSPVPPQPQAPQQYAPPQAPQYAPPQPQYAPPQPQYAPPQAPYAPPQAPYAPPQPQYAPPQPQYAPPTQQQTFAPNNAQANINPVTGQPYTTLPGGVAGLTDPQLPF